MHDLLREKREVGSELLLKLSPESAFLLVSTRRANTGGEFVSMRRGLFQDQPIRFKLKPGKHELSIWNVAESILSRVYVFSFFFCYLTLVPLSSSRKVICRHLAQNLQSTNAGEFLTALSCQSSTESRHKQSKDHSSNTENFKEDSNL